MDNSLNPAALWNNARRILAVRLDNMGDVLMTSPALRALRQSAPGRHITLLASPGGANVASFIPEIDDVMEAAMPWLPGACQDPAAYADTVANLRERQFDAAIIFTVYSQNPLPAALLCWQAGIPLRLAHCRENPYHLLTHWVQDPEPHELVRHEVRRQLDLVATIGAAADDERLSFQVKPEDAVRAIDKLRRAGVDPEQRWIVIHPGASAPSRRYPPENFAAVADFLVDTPDYQVVFTGEAADAGLIGDIIGLTRLPAVSLAGQLTLGELGALLAPAALLISNNTGPVHMAAALGTPVVDLYALTNPQHAPWQVPSRVLYHDVPCRFCYRSVCPQGHHACLRLLDPQRVAQAAMELLAQGLERSAPPLPVA